MVFESDETEASCTYSFDLHTSLAHLWREGAWCDVQLIAADGGSVPAHRLVLAAGSGYFRALFLGAGCSMREARASSDHIGGGGGGGGTAACVALHHESSEQLRVVVEALYVGRVEVTAANLPWLLELSSYLEVPPILQAASQFMRKRVSPSTCVDLLLLASQHHLATVAAEAVAFLAARLPAVRRGEQRGRLARLPVDTLAEVLASEDLTVDSEEDVASTVAEWVAADVSARAHHVPRLLALAQLGALPALAAPLPDELGRSPEGLHVLALLRSGGGAAGTSPPDGGAAAAAAPATPTLRARAPWPPGGEAAAAAAQAVGDAAGGSGSGRVGCVLDGGPLPGVSRRAYRPSRLMIVGGHDESWHGLRSAELYDASQAAWVPAAATLTGVPFCGAARLGREVYVVGGTKYVPVVQRWGGAGGDVWRSCAPMATPRIHAAVAATAGQLYVLGGMAQMNQALASAEAYAPASCSGVSSEAPSAPGGSRGGARGGARAGADGGSWSKLPDMRTPRSALAAASLAGRVYAIGGQAGRHIHRTVEEFDPDAASWQLLSGSMLTERKYCGAAALGGRLYAVGGMNEQRCRLSDVEAYDPREGVWRRVGRMQVVRSSCAVAALQDRLYVCGGSAGDHAFHATVEVFVPAMEKFVSSPPMSCARSGLAAAAF